MPFDLSKPLDLAAERRLASAWRDPEVRIMDIASRFGTTPEDVEVLKRELGPKAVAAPLSNWSKHSDGLRRERQLRVRSQAKAEKAAR